jgi:hypothetical protein
MEKNTNERRSSRMKTRTRKEKVKRTEKHLSITIDLWITNMKDIIQERHNDKGVKILMRVILFSKKNFQSPV